MSRHLANSLLLITAIAWGSVFIAQHWAADHIGPFSFNAVRFGLGAFMLIPLALWERKRHPLRLAALDRTGWALLLGLGLVLGLGSVAQQYGIGYTSVANAGFLTTLYVPMVPLIAFLALRQRVRPIVWPAVVICLLGTYLLAGITDYEARRGDALVILCAVFFALHILIIQAFMRRYPTPFQASFLQALIAAAIALPLGLGGEGLTLSIVGDTLKYTAYSAFMSVVLGFSLQLVGQRHTGPSTAAIILSLEAVFAAAFGWWILGQDLSTPALVGCGLILVGVILVEAVPDKRPAKGSTT